MGRYEERIERIVLHNCCGWVRGQVSGTGYGEGTLWSEYGVGHISWPRKEGLLQVC
jgi:hypothetical protein